MSLVSRFPQYLRNRQLHLRVNGTSTHFMHAMFTGADAVAWYTVIVDRFPISFLYRSQQNATRYKDPMSENIRSKDMNVRQLGRWG